RNARRAPDRTRSARPCCHRPARCRPRPRGLFRGRVPALPGTHSDAVRDATGTARGGPAEGRDHPCRGTDPAARAQGQPGADRAARRQLRRRGLPGGLPAHELRRSLGRLHPRRQASGPRRPGHPDPRRPRRADRRGAPGPAGGAGAGAGPAGPDRRRDRPRTPGPAGDPHRRHRPAGPHRRSAAADPRARPQAEDLRLRPAAVRRTASHARRWRMSRISRSDRPRAALLRWLPLGLVLGLVGIVVPDSAYVEPPAALVRVASDDGRAVGIAHDPAVTWILAIGSDARPGQPVLRSRADAIQLVGINARTGTAAALGIPRDSYVAIPGYGRNRVNAALTFGGPQLMARTVAGMTGVRPDYVMVTSFGGFERMVDAIGGITVNSRYAFSDVVRPRGYRVGKNRLNGLQAHVFARLRKPFPRGDFDRSAN